MTRASQVQREIRQRRPFKSRAQEGTVGLLLTADRVRRFLARIVEPHGITLQQYNVLRILRGAADAGLPTLDIAERMIEEAPGITRLIERLEKKRLVRRRRCPTDRRQVLCWITTEGRDLLARLDGSMSEGDAAVMGSLGDAGVETLIRMLDDVRTRLISSPGFLATKGEH
ncbi:MAG TPA: MarR family transcriptional regulator [Vicinamibacteria bacterium]|nr:MarR family transcriptional regulator [Vicinamibacteria bacterium]